MNKTVTRGFCKNLLGAARAQLFEHGLPEYELRDVFNLIVAAHMTGALVNGNVEDLDAFIASNHATIDPIVSEVIRRAKKAGPR